MKYDGKLQIATGASAKTRAWKNRKVSWSNLVEKLSTENKTNETLKEFLSFSKDDQGTIKDVGGYVGGYLRNGRRKPENVISRQLLTLDIDFAHTELWDDFTFIYDNAAVLHATHKHSEENPRYRLIMPLSEEVSPDEYVAIARRVAGNIGIDLFDNTTFETNRLMFWPSNPKDVEYYCEVQDGPWLNPLSVLESYYDWTDSSEWPTAGSVVENTSKEAKKQEDPATKKGVIGAFCRTYDIHGAIEAFLSDEYEPAFDGRYTYIKGTTAAGMITYDDTFAYSHHGTDPCGGKLCNAFDLVRIHKFGHLDESPIEGKTSSRSFKAMEAFARDDDKVKHTIARETVDNAKYDFSQDDVEPVKETEEDLEWMKELEVDNKGEYKSSAPNLNLIMEHDKRFQKIFRQNDFDGKRYIFKSLPWRKVAKPEPVRNVDYSGVRNYIECIYGISGQLKVDDAMALEFEKNHFHPVKEYLSSLTWDENNRVDTLLINYLGAEDTLYTREAIRKTLVGAVGRILDPGSKFDLVLTLVGAQGTGKSTFVNKLGREWFSDTFMTVTGKEALEQIQGAWIIEMAELAGLRKAEIESVKHFITKREDTFRPAYGRVSETYPRQCIFIGTTNNKDFLKDPSGNRRFMPVDIDPDQALFSVFDDLDSEIDQIWAEAVHLYKKGETNYLSREAEKLALVEQVSHSESDERSGVIEEYLNVKLPKNWDDMAIFERRNHINDPLTEDATMEREYVCVAEIWCECLGKDKDSMDRYKTREINDIMRSVGGWKQGSGNRRFSQYGTQRYYYRV